MSELLGFARKRRIYSPLRRSSLRGFGALTDGPRTAGDGGPYTYMGSCYL